MSNSIDSILGDKPGTNIAETLARILPDAKVVSTTDTDVPALHISHVAVPKGFDLRELRLDLEQHLANPRNTTATAELQDADSFLSYVARHATDDTVVWCDFDPATFKLGFRAVFDEHVKGTAGWRRHQAVFVPRASNEWKIWTGSDAKTMPQLDFAAFLERQELDITAKEGRPSSTDMMQMAANFESSSEKRMRSTQRLQDGSVRLEYIEAEDEKTIQHMRLFERFTIGIPVFWAGPGYVIDARLKYRTSQGKVSFWYELIRPDRSHEAAAKELIQKVREGIGATPLLTGACR
jgi:uncharacterized protein YfdQ (DUF2303 family)